ncbi:kinase-like domain-containing protein [Xylariales sp. AK1849]|nr:kinase-like domain-containing protein [Xylariales sp. AK1849]
MPARFPDTAFAASTANVSSNSSVPESCKLLVAKPGRQIWAIGSKAILKSKAHYPGCDVEVANTNFALYYTEIPMPAILASWREVNRFFTVQERVDGESLQDILPSLTQADIARILDQVGELIAQLHGITNEWMSMLDSRTVIDGRLMKPLPDSALGKADMYHVFNSDAQLADALATRIRGHIDNKSLEALMKRMSSAKPFTLSHSDLHEGNIMVKDGHFTGLIGWELAGFYPVWWELINSCELLSDHLPAALQHPGALRWFEVYHAIRERPHDEATGILLKDYLGLTKR